MSKIRIAQIIIGASLFLLATNLYLGHTQSNYNWYAILSNVVIIIAMIMVVFIMNKTKK